MFGIYLPFSDCSELVISLTLCRIQCSFSPVVLSISTGNMDSLVGSYSMRSITWSQGKLAEREERGITRQL